MNFILGTLRKNRGEPKIIRTAGDKQNKLNKGDIVGRDNGEVLVFAWQDNRTVRMVTTKHNMDMTEIRRRKKGGGWEEVYKPNAIVDYNQFMGG